MAEKDKLVVFRVPVAVHTAFQVATKARHTTMSHVLYSAMLAYLKEHGT